MKHVGLVVSGLGIILFSFLSLVLGDNCCIPSKDGMWNPFSMLSLIFIIYFIMKSVSIKTKKKLTSRHSAMYSRKHGAMWSVLSWVGVVLIFSELVNDLTGLITPNDAMMEWVGYIGLVILVVSIIKIDTGGRK